MKQYEYLVLKLSKLEEMAKENQTWTDRLSGNEAETAGLNIMGREGWELVSVSEYVCYFKRPTN
ncbi:hypothetical protein IMZ31_23520 (plasmid) [Pontibacillus sp. ALD_SL1]|uniref:hypothetical protein n=1 Tax=Pontibacillus sp. ALD_SL1 TaxID=2777185 RepID=UPI001A95D563|nr:hypothetical protein [Pontibacillus sp. ALD_SL1]QST02422.1 hypothetical protein IMZ31_23520 [Pontibacillus sp. ALD_SL1]